MIWYFTNLECCLISQDFGNWFYTKEECICYAIDNGYEV